MMVSVNLPLLETIFSRLERGNVQYGYGRKAPALDCDTSVIVAQGKIDCSGFTRYALAKATAQALIVPDGSQAQREWAEQELGAPHDYRMLNQADPSRLFMCFIKPFEHGCGEVGHVWLTNRLEGHDIPTTMESHGGGGCVSRPWNYRTLWREVFSAFELPVAK